MQNSAHSSRRAGAFRPVRHGSGSASRHTLRGGGLFALLIVCLLMPVCAFGLSQSSAEYRKSEVVYADLTASGDVSEVFVVNQFEVTEPGTITDFGKYDQIRNLTDEKRLQQDGSRLDFRADKGAFYYQGNLSAPKLPWDVSITYYLDGREITPDEARGCSGDMKIRLVAHDNGSAEPTFADSFMIQVTLTLDADVCSDIQADGATIANSGGNRTVAFTALPGHNGDFTCTFTADGFHMDSITLAALPYSMEMDMPSTDGLASGMKQLTDAISQLADGSKALAEGAADFAAGLREMSDGMVEFGDGLNRMDESSGKLLDGSSQINDALALIAQNLEGVDLSFIEDVDFSALIELQESGNWPELTEDQIDGIVGLLDALPELKAALEILKELDVPALSQEITDLAGSLDALASQLDDFDASWIGSLSQIRQAIAALPEQSVSDADIAALRAAVADDEDAAAALEDLLASYEAMADLQAVFAQTDGDLQELEAFLTQLSETSATLPDELTETATSLRMLSLALVALNESGLLEQLEKVDIPDDLDPDETRATLEQVAVILDVLEDFDFEQLKQLPQLVDGLIQLSSEYGQFHDGLGQYFDGVSQLAQNYGTMSDGESKLADGADSLSSGLGEYNDGMQTFDAEVSDLPETMQEQIDAMTSEYTFPAFAGISFVDVRNPGPVAVQFVMQTATIDAPEKPAAPEPAEDDATVFDRFLALFK